MPVAELTYSDPFGTGRRPYVALQLTGLGGHDGGTVTGLIDSGADSTQLPLTYASLLGYAAEHLVQIDIGTAGSVAQAFQATTPCTAFVVGLKTVIFNLSPIFSPASTYVLWGRRDFMQTFDVTIREKQQRFALQW